MRRSRVLGVLGVAAGLAGVAAVVPLVASSAAGDYRLPDLVSVAPPTDNAYLIEGTFSGATEQLTENRLLVRFDGFIDNVGDGPVHFEGNPNARSVAQWAQRASGGAPQALMAADAIASPTGYPLNNDAEDSQECTAVSAAPPAKPAKGPCVIYSTTDRTINTSAAASDGHNHWHLVGAARYSLWNQAGTAQVSPGQKVGFCMYDYDRIPGMPSGTRFYGYAGGTNNFCQQYNPGATNLIEGINPGFRDVYESRLAWQWIDVSNVQPGRYRLGDQVDPFNRIWEKNENNPVDVSAGAFVVPGWVPVSPGAVSTGAGAPVAVALGSTKFGGMCKFRPTDPRPAEGDRAGCTATRGIQYTPADSDRRFVITKVPAKGTLNVALNQPFTATSVTYTPNAGVASTSDTFSYAVYDAASGYPLNRTSMGVNVTIGAGAPAPSVAISGNPSSMVAGSQVDLDAAVSNSTSGVEWSTSAGSIDANGLLTAPASVPAGGTITVTARLASDASVLARATIAVTAAPVPSVAISGNPSSMVAGSRVDLNAAVSNSTSGVEWSTSAGSIDANGLLTAPASVPAGGTITVTARLAADASVLARVTIAVTAAPAPTVAIVNAPSSMVAGSRFDLNAAVTNSTSGVEWSTSAGSIDANGLLTAPASVPAGGTITVTARLASDASVLARATIAVTAAPVPSVAISGNPSSRVAGRRVDLNAAVSNSTSGVEWSTSAGSIDANGLLTAPASVPAGGTITVTARLVSDASVTARVTIAITAAPVPTVAISNAPSSMVAGSRVDLDAAVANSTSGVEWSTSAGSIEANGLLTAPASVPAGGTITVTARLTTNAAVTARVTIAVTAAPVPSVAITGNPSSMVAGSRVDLNAAVVNSNSGVTWSTSAGSIDANGLLTAPASVPAGGTITVTARLTTNAAVTARVTIAVTAAPVPTVTITNAPASLGVSDRADLDATVANSTSGVTWTASAGSIDRNGVFTAPATVPASGSVTVVAKLAANPAISYTVAIRITARPVAPAPGLAISGNPSSMDVNTQVDMDAAVVNSTSGVTWTATAGTIDANGVFTSPSTVPAGGTITVRAALASDPAVFTEARITITTPPRPEPQPLPFVPASPAAAGPAPGVPTPSPGPTTSTPAPSATITRRTQRVPRRLPRPTLVRMGGRVAVWFVPPANGRVAISLYVGKRRVKACVVRRAVSTRPIVCYVRRATRARNVRVVVSQRLGAAPRTLKVTVRRRVI